MSNKKRALMLCSLMLIIGSGLLLAGSCFREKAEAAQPEITPEPSPIKTPHPYSISALREREFPAEEITIVKQVADRELYKSFIVTYPADGLILQALLLHHGTADESVPYDWSLALTQVLDRTGVEYTFHTYQDENHNISKHSYYTVIQRDVAFFRQYIPVRCTRQRTLQA